jgi:2-keto-4-pentenoate hydratase/2-oxohepta-3-ene-1,7-dioic acid hydratase in catechol pathway
MKLLHFFLDGALNLGVKTENGIVDIAQAVAATGAKNIPVSLAELFSGGLSARAALTEFLSHLMKESPAASWRLDEADLTFGSCVPDPGKIMCVGLNYREHAAEAGRDIPEYPVLFSKFKNTIAGHKEPIPLPSNAEQYDYEAELVVVIGRRAKYVEKNDALNYVFGYCNGNDFSARDLQLRTVQWLLGKTLDKFMPIGPYLVTADEIGDPQNLNLGCWANGKQRQQANTSDMIFSVAELVSYASQYMTLEPGDIISTGTPQGVILGTEEKVWLKPGDEVTVEIDKLGRLTNVLTEEII